MAEEFRRLCGELQVGFPQVRHVLVTAAGPGEGTTTVAVNLACALAEDGTRKVLLVDANLRRPAAHRLFDVELSPGLGDWDGTEAPPVKPTDLPNLVVLTAGVHGQAGLFGPRRAGLPALAAQVRASFDFTVWDSPPVVQYPDAALLGTLVDGVLMVIEADRTKADTLAVAGEQLTLAGARLLGAVMNRRGRYVPGPLRTLRGT